MILHDIRLDTSSRTPNRTCRALPNNSPQCRNQQDASQLQKHLHLRGVDSSFLPAARKPRMLTITKNWCDLRFVPEGCGEVDSQF
jgi:hypothetical protein